MNKIIFLVCFTISLITIQNIFAQDVENELNMELIVSDEQRIILFSGFIIAVAGIFIYLARDIIRKKKTDYDNEQFDSKRNKDYEKYHSDWSDEYEEFGSRSNSKIDEEFRDEIQNSTLPDYYKILGLPKEATQEEIKKQYRKLAKQSHPDKNKSEKSDEKMIKINKAYEILADEEMRKKYDRYFEKS